MRSRVLTFVLSLVMFWSGFATQEQAWAQALDVVETVAAGTTDPRHDGSVEDHHLDDQPAHAHAEPLSDLPLVPAAATAPLAPPGRADAPLAAACAGWTSADLQLPRRPPRALV